MRCRPAGRVVLRELAVLVVVVVDQLDLADPLQRAVAVDLGQHADLEAPVARDARRAGDLRRHRALAGQRVPEGVEEVEQRVRTEHRLHRAQERRHEEARHAAVEAVRDAPVVALGELVVEVRVRDREAEPRQQLAVVVADVAVVDRRSRARRSCRARSRRRARRRGPCPRARGRGPRPRAGRRGPGPRPAVPDQRRGARPRCWSRRRRPPASPRSRRGGRSRTRSPRSGAGSGPASAPR